MQNLDVTKTEAAWSSLAGKVYVPHSEEEYHRLVALLDSFIDEVGEDESHPLASLMEVVGVLIEKYEDEHVPRLAEGLSIDAVSENYAHSAEDARQFFVTLSLESDALNAKIIAYADRMGRLPNTATPPSLRRLSMTVPRACRHSLSEFKPYFPGIGETLNLLQNDLIRLSSRSTLRQVPE